MTWPPLLVAALLMADALRLRRRLAVLDLLAAPARPRGPLRWDGAREPGGYDLTVAAGAVLSLRTRRAAVAHARDHGLAALDLIPARLPVVRALDLARSAHGAGFATVVRTSPPATARTGRVVVPCHLTPRVPACQGRAAWLRAEGVSVPQTITRSMLTYALVVAALLSDAHWGPIAVIAYCAVPYAVFARTPLSPRDLHRTALLRPVITPYTWWRTLGEDVPRWKVYKPLGDKG